MRKYLDHLNQHLALPCEASGIGDFPWERKFALGYGDKQEHERLKKGRLSCTDKFLIEKLVYDNSNSGFVIVAEVRRGEDRFDVALDWLRATDQNSPNYVLLDDYAFWRVHYSWD